MSEQNNIIMTFGVGKADLQSLAIARNVYWVLHALGLFFFYTPKA